MNAVTLKEVTLKLDHLFKCFDGNTKYGYHIIKIWKDGKDDYKLFSPSGFEVGPNNGIWRVIEETEKNIILEFYANREKVILTKAEYALAKISERDKNPQLRVFQIRQFGGRFPEFSFKEDPVYSVIMNIDVPGGTKVYEHREHIDLPYEEALRIAKEFEEKGIPENLSRWRQIDGV